MDTTDNEYYDNSMVTSGFKACPRIFLFRHRFYWRREGNSPAMSFGSAWHAGQDVIWILIQQNFDDKSILEAAMNAWRVKMAEEGINYADPTYSLERIQNEGTAKSMFENYIKQRRSFIENVELLAVERPFIVPLDQSGKLFYIGRWDKIFKDKNKIRCGEHKTTSSYKKGGPFKSTFIESFSPDSRIDGYLFAGRLVYGDDFDAIWVDAALVHKTVHDGFKFIPISRKSEMVDCWLDETKYWISLIQEEDEKLKLCKDSDPYLAAFPKRTNMCGTYTGCGYKDICRFYPNPLQIKGVPNNYVVDKWEPFDVLGIEKLMLEKEGKDDPNNRLP